MKRFLLFACDRYYPKGGWNDLQGSYDTQNEAAAAGRKPSPHLDDRWFQVIDFETGTEVAGGPCP